MTIQNDFVPFAASVGASVESQAAYIADDITLANGFQNGIADNLKLNKVWRQASIISSVVAQYINAVLQVSTIDDGTTQTLLQNLAEAIRTNARAVDTSSTPNVLVASITPAPIALNDGLVVTLKPNNTNTTGVTFNLNGLGAYPVQTAGGTLQGGELVASKIYQLAFIGSSNVWIILGNTVTGITQSPNDNSTKFATTAYVDYATLHVGFSASTRMPFAQASAPTGWTQDTTDTADNRMLRVVNTVGNGVGGSYDPTIMNVVPAHTHGFSTGGESAGHTHYDNGHGHVVNQWAGYTGGSGGGTNWYGVNGVWSQTGYANLSGESAGHTHSGSTDNGSSHTNWTPRYVNLIICQKN